MNERSPMPRLSFLSSLLCATVAWVAACGDSPSAPTAAADGIPLTVFVPGPRDPDEYPYDGTAFASLEYRVTCDAQANSEPVLQDATLEARDADYTDPDFPVDVWRGAVEAEPGECVVTLGGRAENGEYLCTGSYRVTVTEHTSALYFDMGFCLQTCPEVELPEDDSAPKTNCIPNTGLLLWAETPLDLPGAVAVEYTLRAADALDSALWAPTLPTPRPVLEGTLEARSFGTADFGQGPVTTFVSQTTVVDLGWAHWDLELTAVDDEGRSLCQTQTRLDLETTVAKVHVVMPCSP